MKYLFMDTETTGLLRDTATSNGDEVIQISGLLVDENMNPIRIFDYLCDTTKVSMSRESEKLHKISMNFLRSQVKDIYLEEVLRTRVPELFDEKDLIFVGHNVEFDIAMICQTMRDCEVKPDFGSAVVAPLLPKSGRHWIDTVSYTMKRTPRGSFKQKLSVLAERYTKDFNRMLDELPGYIYDTNYSRTRELGFHDAFSDTLYCYLVFKNKIWKQKLI